VLDQAQIDRLRRTETGGYPVLSVYVNLQPGPESLRNLPARIKDLLAQAEVSSEALPRSQRLSVRGDVHALSRDIGRFGADLGHGVAVFRSSGAGIDEQFALPGPVRDRAIVDGAPYIRPLEAMVEHYQRYCVAVIGRRFGSIFRFSMDQLDTWEEMRDEEIRKANYGGFSGYEEQRVRARADEMAARHYRHVAERLTELRRSDGGFDLLIVGGSDSHVAGLLEALPPDVADLSAGTFVIDPGTMTPATVLDHARRVAGEWEVQEENRLVAGLFDAAASGRMAVLGLEETCGAVNRRSVEVLYVQAERITPGSTCLNCGRVTCDIGSTCPGCGGHLSPIPDVVDRLSESVRATGGRVRHILNPGPLAEVEAGALLRYGDPMVDPT
jgi:peptide subunit release factor 1 (eRF1)